MVIFCGNPIYSILSFICVVIGFSCILLWCNVEFLAFIILLIYLGAIAVLFLFIVLALQLKEVHVTLPQRTTPVSQMLCFCLLVKVIFYMYCYNSMLVLTINSFSFEYSCNSVVINAMPNVLLKIGGDAVIFLHLFTDKSGLFILVGFILLFSMVGSIALCVRPVRI